MPRATRSLTLPQAVDLIHQRAFAERTGERVGLEVEWLTLSRTGNGSRVSLLREMVSPVEPLPAGSRITFEPGGQVEISTTPAAGSAEAISAARADGDIVRRVLRENGIETAGVGMDPARPLALRTDEPRYVAMRAYFDATGPAGGYMMCGTAAIQVNVDAGVDDAGLRRWSLANRLGPTLVAAFANSPWQGHRSARMAAWLAIDPTRTAPVADGPDPVGTWVRYALNARVMLVRTLEGFAPVTDGLSFKSWIEHGHRFGFPTEEDLLYHLTTLFPPVRPRGWLEIRMIDMLPDPWWCVPAAVTHALLTDQLAGAEAEEAARGTEHLWAEGAESALEHPALARSARRCFAAALDALERAGGDGSVLATVAAYTDRFVARGRCPADERPERAEAI